jgi:ribosomal protein S27AE
MAEQAKLLSQQVDRLYRTRPDYRLALDFYIFFQKNAEVELESMVLPGFREDSAEERLSLGLPLFEVGELPIDIEAAGRFIGRLAQADFPVMENLLAVVDTFRDRPDDLAWICRVLTAGDGEGLAAWSRARGLDKDLVAVVLKWALRPSFLKLRQAEARHMDDVDWRERVCPICGSGPFMARLEKDGGRTLACRLCGQEWRFPRLKCPFCETEDRSVLSYLSAGDGSGYRIDVCGLCRHYLKVVDSREQEDVLPLELEDLLTQHLDLVARNRGYNNLP